jgi:hypothetical protein
MRRALATGVRRINNPPQIDNLPHKAASRNEWWRFSKAVAGAYESGRRIDNPPQVKNLPHNCAENAMDSSTKQFGYHARLMMESWPASTRTRTCRFWRAAS